MEAPVQPHEVKTLDVKTPEGVYDVFNLTRDLLCYDCKTQMDVYRFKSTQWVCLHVSKTPTIKSVPTNAATFILPKKGEFISNFRITTKTKVSFIQLLYNNKVVWGHGVISAPDDQETSCFPLDWGHLPQTGQWKAVITVEDVKAPLSLEYQENWTPLNKKLPAKGPMYLRRLGKVIEQ
jgi:hypothetical protein